MELKKLLNGLENYKSKGDLSIDIKKVECNSKKVVANSLFIAIKGYDFDGQTNTVDVYIRALRNKLGKYRDLIKTVRGIGYVLGDEQ